MLYYDGCAFKEFASASSHVLFNTFLLLCELELLSGMQEGIDKTMIL